MATLGLKNFGSLSAPIQPLSEFDDILGNTSDPIQGAGLLGYGRSLSYADGSVGEALQGITVSPVDFGAIGDGNANDTVALLAAFNTGLLVDGRGKTYGVSGSIQPSAFAGLVRANLKQLTPSTSNCRTLYINNITNPFVIRDVKVDLGGLYTFGTLGGAAGIWIDSSGLPPNQFMLDNVRCTNGGPGSGISIQNAQDFVLQDCIVDNFKHNIGAIDDVIQAVWLNNCTNFSILGGSVTNITGVSTVRFTRGFTFGGCSYFNVVGAKVNIADQCFDITGTLGNHDFVFSACIAQAAGTFGFKFANSAYQGRVVGCIASDCGLKSFVVSGQTEIANPVPRDIEFSDCHSINAGSNGVWPSAQGFRVESVATIDASYPRGVRFIDCTATDMQVTPTMVTGFYNDVAPIGPTATGYNKSDAITCENCKTYWTGTPGTSFSGIHFPLVRLTGTGTDTVTTSTWTRISFNAEISDPAAMHDLVSNNDTIYIKEPGWYLINAQAAFQSNSTGLRQLRFTLNGVASAKTAYVGAHPTLVTYITNQDLIYVDTAGYTIAMEAFQTSGGSLTVDRTQTFMSLIRAI